MYKYILFFLLPLLWACEKAVEPEPTVTVEKIVGEPLEGQVYQQGDTVFLQADMRTSNWTMHAYEIYVYDSSKVYFSAGEHLHELIYEIDTFFVNTAEQLSMVDVEFRLHLDHKGDRRDLVRQIQLLP